MMGVGRGIRRHSADIATVALCALVSSASASPPQTTAPSDQAFDLDARRAAHWAWQPVKPVEPPAVSDPSWPITPIDWFVLAKLEGNGLRPAPPADKRTLIRRTSFDLIGLPPTPEEVEAFVNDDSPDANERLVDRLLASPHFGEKWARHWLDLVRYAETRGHEFEPLIPNAWQYRDYVIRAFNADVPYDRFVTEHIAGDLLEEPRLHPTKGFNESILGTGFWFLGEEVHSPVDLRQDETDRLDNRLDTMTKTFLGLTVACARCHDHKFDAISQKDYYALTGFLLSGTYRQVRFETLEHNRNIAEERDRLQRDAAGKLLKQIARVEKPTAHRLAGYLLAAREVIADVTVGNALSGVPRSALEAERHRGRSLQRFALDGERVQQRIADAVSKGSLERALLAGWVRELIEARADNRHPLRAFAEIADDSAADDPVRFAARLKAVLSEQKQLQEQAATTHDPHQVLIDYSRAGSTGRGPQWYADGFTFGLRPVRPGDVVLGDDPNRPIGEVISYGAARRDPAWNGLKQAADNERDHGTLGNWDRAGRTIRTPKITLESGRLWYLVRGSGRAYASVDSHLIVAGPLHGRVLLEWGGDPDEWQWVRHDLSSYKGHRAHIEFSPKSDDGELAIAKVVESERNPGPANRPNRLLFEALGEKSVTGPDGLAAAYERLFGTVLETMSAGRIAEAKHAEDVAELADWLARHIDLFSTADDPARRRLAEISRPFIEKRRKLVARITAESHTAPAMFEGNGVNEHRLIRGSHRTPDELVSRRFLEALGGAHPDGYGPGSGRLTLARQMVADENPFTSRVIVNRIWHHLFGRGIVPTVDNFGVLGQSPSHSELLDRLAHDFRHDQRWSIKRLVKLLVLSRTYRMSSELDPRAEKIDPENVLLHRMPVRRLPAEAIRDAILAVSGRLDRTVLGPPVEVNLTPFMEGRGRPSSSGPLDGNGRRSIYVRVRRNFLSPMMLAFDMPIPFATRGRRSVSNVPAQALILLNDPFVVDQAKVWAEHVLAESGSSQERITRMYLTAFARPPSADELSAAAAFLEEQGEAYGIPAERRSADERVWADLAHVLVNAKEFIFVR